ncbi:RluA family pseudouridine synthase [Rapidithrix thailandica]|uniref:Pseudouridine synthase n=1 Tax=Rapidithrix thailandica TaxID=413964 RepID=A0AAW9S483_9BACT
MVRVGRYYEIYRLEVENFPEFTRIDEYLYDRFPKYTLEAIQECIKSSKILINGEHVPLNHELTSGDRITALLDKDPYTFDIVPQNIPLEKVYEDNTLLVVNKPAGMVVHPGHNNETGTLVNSLTFHYDDLPSNHNGSDKPGIVHRIDKDTSGLLVIAKTDRAMESLASQFFDHSIERTYYALVWGNLEKDSGTIEWNVGRSHDNKRLRVVYEDGMDGKPAITHYKVIRRYGYLTLVRCNLETGRTHQIRVHMKHLGHTLFGDVVYGGNHILVQNGNQAYYDLIHKCLKIMPRQALHAKSLGFEHPANKKFLYFEQALPDDFQKVIQLWEAFIQTHKQEG